MDSSSSNESLQFYTASSNSESEDDSMDNNSSINDSSGEEEVVGNEQVVHGILPYHFEPLAEDFEAKGLDIPHAEATAIEEYRLGNTNWCSCDRCGIMPTVEENQCCNEFPEIDEKRGAIECITLHEDFETFFLDRRHLWFAYMEKVNPNVNQQPTEPGEGLIHRAYRNISYRRFVRWIHGLLPNRRVIIPSCVVHQVRSHFESDEYCGFRPFLHQ